MIIRSSDNPIIKIDRLEVLNSNCETIILTNEAVRGSESVFRGCRGRDCIFMAVRVCVASPRLLVEASVC